MLAYKRSTKGEIFALSQYSKTFQIFILQATAVICKRHTIHLARLVPRHPKRLRVSTSSRPEIFRINIQIRKQIAKTRFPRRSTIIYRQIVPLCSRNLSPTINDDAQHASTEPMDCRTRAGHLLPCSTTFWPKSVRQDLKDEVEGASTTAAEVEGPLVAVAATFTRAVSNGGVAHPITLLIILANRAGDGICPFQVFEILLYIPSPGLKGPNEIWLTLKCLVYSILNTYQAFHIAPDFYIRNHQKRNSIEFTFN